MASNSDNKQRSRFFRVAVEGATTDRREISRQDILDIAETYSPDVYGARIWIEHLRSKLPDGPFRAYGDVVAVKAEEVEIQGQTKLALFAQVEPTGELVNLVNNLKQKVYTSIEIAPNFAGSGRAYLYGLSVTDSPASLSTTMLAFSAKHPEQSPLQDRKLAPENCYSEAAEVTVVFEDDTPCARPGPVAALLGSLGFGQRKKHPAPAPVADSHELEAFATKLLHAVNEQDAAVAELLQSNRSLRAKIQSLTAQMNGVRKTLDETPQHFNQRPIVPGSAGDDAANATDC